MTVHLPYFDFELRQISLVKCLPIVLIVEYVWCEYPQYINICNNKNLGQNVTEHTASRFDDCCSFGCCRSRSKCRCSSFSNCCCCCICSRCCTYTKMLNTSSLSTAHGTRNSIDPPTWAISVQQLNNNESLNLKLLYGRFLEPRWSASARLA